MEFSFPHNERSKSRQGSRPGRWPFSRIPSVDRGTWVPSVLLPWNSVRVLLTCMFETASPVPQLFQPPGRGKRETGESRQFSWTHLTAGKASYMLCLNPGVRMEVGLREGECSCWGKWAVIVTVSVEVNWINWQPWIRCQRQAFPSHFIKPENFTPYIPN